MLQSFNKLLGKIIGNKSDRDIKEIMPLVEKTKEAYSKLQSLSNDELRAKTPYFKSRINEYIKGNVDKIASIKQKIEAEENVDLKEEHYKEIDKIETTIDEQLEEILMELLPEAFAVVKETARRFTENKQIEVTATEMDRNLAASRESI